MTKKKSDFDGEGNPTVGLVVPVAGKNELKLAADSPANLSTSHPVEVTDAERRALLVLRDRDRTSRVAHGGLKSLLQLSDDDARLILGFLNRL